MNKSISVQSPTEVDDKDPAKRFSFLHLPAEIRNQIYRYSLVNPSSPRTTLGLVQPSLTRANRQIRSEALPIYYGNNRFLINIPAKPPMNKPDEWANFIRMFRVFKAGRSGGPGTGSLQFIRNLRCKQPCFSTRESFWMLEVAFMEISEGRGSVHRDCGDYDTRSSCRPRSARAWQDWDHVYRAVEKHIKKHPFLNSDTIMLETCVQRLISTAVMVATECPGVINEIHFHSDKSWDELEGSE